jgi:hypothetical protein
MLLRSSGIGTVVAVVLVVVIIIAASGFAYYYVTTSGVSSSSSSTLISSSSSTSTSTSALTTSLQWQAGWEIPHEPLDYSNSKVTYKASTGNLSITFVLVGAKPNWWYQVGIHLLWSNCTQAVSQFGQFADLLGPVNVGCKSSQQAVEMGVVTTDSLGDGSFHVNVGSIVPGTYHIVFDARRGTGCNIDVDDPGRNCPIVFQAPSFQAPATIVIPD